MARRKARRKRRRFTEQFKADAVRLVASGKTIAEVTAQFDLTETSLREWVRRAEADAGRGPPDALTTAERAELIDLRKRLKRAEMERDILKKATAFFAKENA
jgi:transposase